MDRKVKPARVAERLLITNLILLSLIKNSIIPPVFAKSLISLIVRIGRFEIELMIYLARYLTDDEMNRI